MDFSLTMLASNMIGC